MKPVLRYTKDLPKKEGFYWFTDGGEHTPTILEVKKAITQDGAEGERRFWASNDEFCFVVTKPKNPEFWCYIPEPSLRKNV